MKKVLLSLSFIFIIISISIIGCKVINAKKEITLTLDEITIQKDKDDYITPYGYTIDNPNIILNPYDISPLTAIIAFTTKESVPVTITIKGKDNNSTYTNKFESTTNHYIPVYGLYPNYKNKVILNIENITKEYTIQTEPIEINIEKENLTNNTNNLLFISNNSYPYAIDSNNEIRWYLTKEYLGKLNRLTNGNFLLSTDIKNNHNIPNGAIEIDLLGKIYNHYYIEEGYLKEYIETKDNYYILSKYLLEINKQNLNDYTKIELDNDYKYLNYNEESNNLVLSTDTKSIKLDLKTKNITESPHIKRTSNNLLLPPYHNNENYKIKESKKISISNKTKTSNNNIFLLKTNKIDNNYKKYNIKYKLTEDTIIIEGNLSNIKNSYLILDKFLGKKIYKIKDNKTIINKNGLKGNYSIYIKLGKKLYKTDKYIKI